MDCREPGCKGIVWDGACQDCGAPAGDEPESEDSGSPTAIIESVRSLLEPKEVAPSKEDLLRASRQLRKAVHYNYDAWRLHADLLLNALRLLETRQLQPDANFKILAIPLREDDLRDAAEAALRQCAHCADSTDKRIAVVDEANRVRRKTWF